MTGGAVINPVSEPREAALQSPDQDCHYPRRALTKAYLRAAAGLIMVGIPLILGDPGNVAFVILGSIALALLAYGIRAWLRGMGRVRVDGVGISIYGPLSVAVRWDEMTAVKLSFYSTQRDKTDGWMQLVISGTRRKLTIESTLDGFSEIARRVADESKKKDIKLSPSTINNFKPLGIQVGESKLGNPKSAERIGGADD
jgi:uncharacterized membrane protein